MLFYEKEINKYIKIDIQDVYFPTITKYLLK